MRRLLPLPLLFSACIAPLPLGAPCELAADNCEGDLVCTPLEDRAICAPDRGEGPPPDAACVPRGLALIDEAGRLAAAAAATDAARARFGVLWSSSANTTDEGELNFTLVDARAEVEPRTVTVASSGFQDLFAQALAYSPTSDRYAAVWSQDGELFVRMIDGDGTLAGVARALSFTSEFFDNMDLVVVNGEFQLFVSHRDQDPGPGFGAAGIFRLPIEADGNVPSLQLLLDDAVFDGRTVVDANEDVWFTFSEGNTVQNHVSVGRISGGELQLRFLEHSTMVGVIGSQVLPFGDGPRLAWREQSTNTDAICELDACGSTMTNAPFRSRGYGNGELELVLRDDGLARLALVDGASSEPTLLVYDPADNSVSGFTSLGPGDGFPRVVVAEQGDATLAVYSGQLQAGSNANTLDLEVRCEVSQ